jgi:hypothetical protein
VLHLRKTIVTQAGVNALTAALPGLKVTTRDWRHEDSGWGLKAGMPPPVQPPYPGVQPWVPGTALPDWLGWILVPVVLMLAVGLGSVFRMLGGGKQGKG